MKFKKAFAQKIAELRICPSKNLANQIREWAGTRHPFWVDSEINRVMEATA